MTKLKQPKFTNTFSQAALDELIGAPPGKRGFYARKVASYHLRPYYRDVARSRSERKDLRPLRREIHHRLMLILLASGSTARAAKLLGVAEITLYKWMSYEYAPSAKYLDRIDHFYLLALEAVRRTYLRGSIKIRRVTGVGSKRHMKSVLEAFSKRCGSRQQLNKKPLKYEQPDQDPGSAGEETQIYVEASPLPEETVTGRHVPTLWAPATGGKDRIWQEESDEPLQGMSETHS